MIRHSTAVWYSPAAIWTSPFFSIFSWRSCTSKLNILLTEIDDPEKIFKCQKCFEGKLIVFWFHLADSCAIMIKYARRKVLRLCLFHQYSFFKFWSTYLHLCTYALTYFHFYLVVNLNKDHENIPRWNQTEQWNGLE